MLQGSWWQMACCGLFFATSAFETIGRRSLRDKVKTENKRKLAAHGLCTGGVKRRISEQVAGHVVLAEDKAWKWQSSRLLDMGA